MAEQYTTHISMRQKHTLHNFASMLAESAKVKNSVRPIENQDLEFIDIFMSVLATSHNCRFLTSIKSDEKSQRLSHV